MSGMKTMARLELMLRFRAGRWRWLLLSWFLGLVRLLGAPRAGGPAVRGIPGP